MRDHDEHFYPVIFFAVVGVLVLASFLALTPRLTGDAIALAGGNVTALNVRSSSGSLSWLGVYGNLTSASVDMSSVLVSGQVLLVNLSYSVPFTDETIITASVVPDPAWDNLSPASHAQVNSFLGLLPGDAQSAQATLLSLENFTVGGAVYELWSAVTSSVSGSYVTGVLVADGELLLVSRPVNGVGFDGSQVDFQMLLPLPPAGFANFSFFVFEQSSLPGLGVVDCNASIGLFASLHADNASVLVDWDDVPGALEYEVLFVDGPVMGSLDFSSASVVSTGLSSSFVDASPGVERYYRVRLRDASGSCLGGEVAGSLLLNLSPDYNLVSTPFLALDASIEDSLRSIVGGYSEVLAFDNERKAYDYYIIVGNSVFRSPGFVNVSPGRGHWVRSGSDVGLRFSGSLWESMDERLSPDYNLVGFPVISNVQGNASIPFVLSSIDGSYSEVLAFDNEMKSYDYYIIVGNSVFRSPGFVNVSPGRGFWVKVGSNASLVYNVSGVLP